MTLPELEPDEMPVPREQFVVEPFDQARMDMVNREYITQADAEEMFDAYLDRDVRYEYIHPDGTRYPQSRVLRELTPHAYDDLMDKWLNEQNTEVSW